MSIRSLALRPSDRLWSTELLAMVAFAVPDDPGWPRIGVFGSICRCGVCGARRCRSHRSMAALLVHLGIEVPRWLAVGMPIGLGVWFGRRGGEGYRFMLALATVLAALFLLGVQAFQNYWYLVASMALIALVDRYNPVRTAEPATPASSRAISLSADSPSPRPGRGNRPRWHVSAWGRTSKTAALSTPARG